MASLDKAYDKLEREESSSFPELEFSDRCAELLSLARRDGLYIIDQHGPGASQVRRVPRKHFGNKAPQSQQQPPCALHLEFPADDALRPRKECLF